MFYFFFVILNSPIDFQEQKMWKCGNPKIYIAKIHTEELFRYIMYDWSVYTFLLVFVVVTFDLFWLSAFLSSHQSKIIMAINWYKNHLLIRTQYQIIPKLVRLWKPTSTRPWPPHHRPSSSSSKINLSKISPHMNSDLVAIHITSTTSRNLNNSFLLFISKIPLTILMTCLLYLFLVLNTGIDWLRI